MAVTALACRRLAGIYADERNREATGQRRGSIHGIGTTGIGEDCGGGDTLIFDVGNIGEKEGHLLEDIGWLFHGEYIWREAFCSGKDGTYDPDFPCPADIAASLTAPPDILDARLVRVPKTIPAGTARMYEHPNFGGAFVELPTNSVFSSPSGVGAFAQDVISSIKISGAVSLARSVSTRTSRARILGH